LREIHGSVRDKSWIPEYNDIVIETDSMPNRDWRRMSLFSMITMLLHSMKLGFYVMRYVIERYDMRYARFLEFFSELQMAPGTGTLFRREVAIFEDYLDSLMAGQGRGVVMPDHGDIYWDSEEAAFLRIAENLDEFYEELHDLVGQFLAREGVACAAEEIAEVVRYQHMRMPGPTLPRVTQWTFAYNFPEYFQRAFGTDPVDLARDSQTMVCDPIDFEGARAEFAKRTILWGRKSGALLTKCRWESLDRPWVNSDTPVVGGGDAGPVSLPRAANLGGE
jgi:putative methyltransferase